MTTTSIEDDEIVAEFLVESHENLDQLDRDLVQLEQEPGSRELLSSIFRTIHTIKGASGFLAFGRLESLTHVGENLLSRLRDGDMTMTPATAEVLLRMVDAVRGLLELIERTGRDEDVPGAAVVDVPSAVAAITAVLDGTVPDGTVPDGTVPGGTVPDVAAAVTPPAPQAIEPLADAELPVVLPVVLPEVEGVAAEQAWAAADGDRRTGDRRRGVQDTTVRVDVELLDTMMRLVGELVLARNQILQQSDVRADPDLARATQRLNLVAGELQDSVMKTRMQPIGQLWAKFPRVVRDLAAQLGRQVRLEMVGQETELDRSLLEAVKDPLTHLVRNAVDHGIEPPDVRVAKGKSAEGILTLRAYHESGQVVVEIGDDGKGLDPALIGRIAVQRGVITQDAVARATDRELVELIFRPGFSTAATVSNVSGRGVGMDVVRTNIERIGGTVDLASPNGCGTTVRVRIPLTLAIVPALIVGEGGERYAIPQTNLVELVRLDKRDVEHGVETLVGAPVLRLRGMLLPLVSLAGALDLPAVDSDLSVVVVQADEVRFGLLVSEVHDTQEIVVKPLGRQLKALDAYAGATIMGDGRVALILDVGGLARAAGLAAHPPAATEPRGDDAERRTMLVLDVGGGRRAALPLDAVSRLEELPREAVERSGLAEVVQYRDGILPLVRLADAIGVPCPPDDPETLSVIVHGHGADRVGVVADRVVDVVETTGTPHPVGVRPGVLGSLVVQDRVTDIVDVDALTRMGAPA
ncbi:chemotaxis protein CheA [Jatrophihabitans fulvus]